MARADLQNHILCIHIGWRSVTFHYHNHGGIQCLHLFFQKTTFLSGNFIFKSSKKI
jgi:hypothetical protein